MPERAKTYDMNKVIVTVAGVPITGVGEGSKVTVEFDGDAWNKKTGNGGAVIRSRQNQNNGGTYTLNIQYGEEVNAYLQSLKNVDDITGAGTFPVAIIDSNGSTLVSSISCWIQNNPGLDFGADPEDYEWVIAAADISAVRGVSR